MNIDSVTEQTKSTMSELSNELVCAENLFSIEYYKKNDEEVIQVLRNISFHGYASECWAVMGNKVFEIKLLLDILSNSRPYQKGSCSLNNVGMMRKKRIILPHLFYIGSTNMLYSNMTVLEYLMFISVNSGEPVVQRQRDILTHLVDLGLGHLSLLPIEELTPPEKSLDTTSCTLY
jgi:ABC-2 type transport system ATP-binding protein